MPPVRERRAPVCDALEEVLAFESQRFGTWQRRYGDVAVTVRELELAKGVGVRRRIDPAVVDTQLFKCLDIVVNDHFVTTHDRQPANLVRVEPAHVDLCPDSIGENQIHVADVFDLGLDVRAPTRRHP